MHVVRKICTRVAVMEEGKIVEQGDVLDVFLHPQQHVTKTFVRPDDEEDNIDRLLEQCKSGQILRLHFIGEAANRPLISQFVKQFPVDINILQGKITQMRHGAYGTLFVQIDGEDEDIKQAVAFMKEQTAIEVEVIYDAR